MMRYQLSGQKESFSFTFDGLNFTAYRGDTIASALYAAGIRIWRRSHSGDDRGLFCGIGLCFDCLIKVDGKTDKRACLTLITPGMVVESNLKG